MTTDCPNSLKIIQPFLKLAKEYDKRDTVVAYWSRYYAVQIGIKNKTKDNISFLMNLMDTLEKNKSEGSQEEAITNDIVAQAHLENKGTQLFLWADTEDRSARFTKNVVKSFYSASLIFDILSVFGEINDEILAQRKYAKWKAAYINNCLKKGETPVAGPIDSEQPAPTNTGLPYPAGNTTNLPYPAGNTTNLPYPNPGLSQTYPPSSQPPASNTTPVQYNPHSIFTSNQPSDNSTQLQPGNIQPSLVGDSTASTNVQLGPMDYTKAQKYCKYASSALQYEDVPTAVDNLQKALKLLQTGKDD